MFIVSIIFVTLKKCHLLSYVCLRILNAVDGLPIVVIIHEYLIKIEKGLEKKEFKDI